MSLVHNEQYKLSATLINTVAAGGIVVGVLTPFANGLQAFLREGVSTATPLVAPEKAVAYTVIWFVISGLLHVTARRVLEYLED